MLFNVPQFTDIEDKIVGPFTAKQLGWLVVGGIMVLIFFHTLTTGTAIVAGVIVISIVGALAFYRPYNQSLIKFISSGIYFAFRPKIYIWKRKYASIKTTSKYKVAKKNISMKKKKILTSKKIKEISSHLDS